MTNAKERVGTTSDDSGATRREWSFAARAATWVTCVGVLTVLMLLRQSGEPPWRTVWAEDGVFVGEAYKFGIGSIDTDYAGYLHVGSRLLALTGTLVPIDQLARFNALSAALILAVLAVLAFSWSEDLVRSPLLRGMLALAICLHPITIVETLASTTNLEWPLTFLSVLALLHRPRSRRQMATQTVIAALAPISQAAALPWAPIALWYVLRGGRDGRKLVGIVFLASCVLQTLVALSLAVTGNSTALLAPHSRSPFDIIPVWLAETWGNAIFGFRWMQDLWHANGYRTLVVVGVIAIALITFLVMEGKKKRPVVLRGLGLVALSLVFVAFVVVVRGFPLLSANELPIGAAHYVYVSLLLLLTGIFALVEALPERVRRITTVVLLVQMMILITFGFRATNGRSHAPAWHDAVVFARFHCEEADVTSTVVVIAPDLPWVVEIPCSTVG